MYCAQELAAGMATSCQNQFLARQLRPAAAVAGRPLIAAQRRSSAAARSAHRAPRRAGAPAPRASVVATVEKAPATTALDEAYNKQMQAQVRAGGQHARAGAVVLAPANPAARASDRPAPRRWARAQAAPQTHTPPIPLAPPPPTPDGLV